MLTFEIVANPEAPQKEELNIFFDGDGLSLLLDELSLLRDQKTDHLHLMCKSWGGSELEDVPHVKENLTIRHVKMFLLDDKTSD